MLRRILIIILAVVVIIAAIFAIRWFLNQNSDETTTLDDNMAEVVDEIQEAGEDIISPDEITIVEEDSQVVIEGGEADSTDGSEAYPVEGDEAAPTDGGEAAVTEGDETAPADSSEAAVTESGEDVATDGAADSSLGGVAGGDDTNVGGGLPAESGEAAPETSEAVPETSEAVESTEGTGGGIGDVAAVSPAATFVQPGVPTQHTVENREWLTQLARCYGTTVADIQAANNYACPDLIEPGWVVNISNPGNAGPITINEAPCFNYHTVQQGETLYSIATHYGISYQWLARINAIYNYNIIYAGQQLVIPNPVDPVFTQIPAEPYFYSNCWYGNCPVYPVQPIYPVPAPYPAP